MVSLHNEIMNIPCHFKVETHSDNERWYRLGHRDARHAAAELALGLEAVNAELLEALDHPLLRQLIGEIEDSDTHEAGRLWALYMQWHEVRMAAIAKATGEQS